MRRGGYIRQVLSMKLFHTRTKVLMFLQACVLYLYMKPLVRFSQATQCDVTPWYFPFIISNLYFVFLFMLGVVYYFSDVPFMQYPNMYQVIRVGRKRWVIGQISSILIQAVLMVLYNFGISLIFLIGHCEIGTDWGKILHTLAMTNAGEMYGFLFDVPYETLQNFSPLELTGIMFVVGSLVIGIFGIVMFALSLLWNRVIAVAGATMMVVMVYIIENLHVLLKQKFATFAPVVWMRVANLQCKEYGNPIMPSLTYILITAVLLIVLLSAVILWKAQKIEFQWVKED